MKRCFAQKRKNLLNNLGGIYAADPVACRRLRTLGKPARVRAEQLSAGRTRRLFDYLTRAAGRASANVQSEELTAGVFLVKRHDFRILRVELISDGNLLHRLRVDCPSSSSSEPRFAWAMAYLGSRRMASRYSASEPALSPCRLSNTPKLVVVVWIGGVQAHSLASFAHAARNIPVGPPALPPIENGRKCSRDQGGRLRGIRPIAAGIFFWTARIKPFTKCGWGLLGLMCMAFCTFLRSRLPSHPCWPAHNPDWNGPLRNRAAIAGPDDIRR